MGQIVNVTNDRLMSRGQLANSILIGGYIHLLAASRIASYRKAQPIHL